jgi:hypothetical protein
MTGRIASAFATVPGVIGYDLLNEPCGDERCDLAPLYEEMAAVIRARNPAAILFVVGQVTSNCGIGTRLPRPSYGGFAYAPHFYKPLALVLMGWRSTRLLIDHGFRGMGQQADRWDCPLFGNVLIRHALARRALVCYSPYAGPITVRVSEPAIMTRAEPGSSPHS